MVPTGTLSVRALIHEVLDEDIGDTHTLIVSGWGVDGYGHNAKQCQ